MLLKIEQSNSNRSARRLPGKHLKNFELDERGLQKILFESLGDLLPDEELLLISQSRNWREEPDLLAVDRQGNLYIFEIKAWESHPENLLQALRYGQIFGPYDYGQLNEELFKKFDKSDLSLAEVHKSTFDIELKYEQFNQKQVFVILTNGIDVRTRQAVKYWRSKAGLDVRPWIYRVYPNDNDSFLLEIVRFGLEDYPSEDVSSSFHILNTNCKHGTVDHNDMISNKKAAAYFDPPKHKIEKLLKGDTVFLYQNKVGIVAVGKASGKLEKAPYHGKQEHADEEYFMTLNSFRTIEPPLSAAQIKKITGIDHVFMTTLFSVDKESGQLIQKEIDNRT